MLQPRISTSLRRAIIGAPSLCIRCQRQALQRPEAFTALNARRHLVSTTKFRIPAEPSQKPQSQPQPPQPNEKEKDDEPEFIPKALGRPIGFQRPPKAGENTGVKEKKVYTGATMSERNLEKRKDIVEAWGQNYFRDFKNIRKYRKGKLFIANPRIFRSDAALYFPNFHGESLAKSPADTTPVLKGKVSVVTAYSSAWGEAQAQTFTTEKNHPELHTVLKNNDDVAQMVEINIETNVLKAWIIAMNKWSLKRKKRKEDWEKYFIIRKGVSDRIRETIGMLNGRIGYVYLIDENCKIRWAACADAEGTEKEDLMRGLEKLIREFKLSKTKKSEKLAEIRAQRESASVEV